MSRHFYTKHRDPHSEARTAASKASEHSSSKEESSTIERKIPQDKTSHENGIVKNLPEKHVNE